MGYLQPADYAQRRRKLKLEAARVLSLDLGDCFSGCLDVGLGLLKLSGQVLDAVVWVVVAREL
jgi:hypothetical protein